MQIQISYTPANREPMGGLEEIHDPPRNPEKSGHRGHRVLLGSSVSQLRHRLARIALANRSVDGFAGRPMLKILRTVDGLSVVFVLSGRIEAEHLAELRALFDSEEHPVALDLKEVTLVDRDTIRFLAGCEANGLELRNCPAYIRQWLEREGQR